MTFSFPLPSMSVLSEKVSGRIDMRDLATFLWYCNIDVADWGKQKPKAENLGMAQQFRKRL